jgi:NDP-sugar pyrophosphorylase family protein
MGYAIPIELYNKLEEKLGRETAIVVTEVLEASIKEAIKEGRSELKAAIYEDLKKELATKYDLKIVEAELRNEIDLVRKEIDLVRKEIELVRKDMKIMTIILIAVIIFLNQNSLEFIARLLGLLK